MLNIILASVRPESMAGFIQTLASDKGIHLKKVSSGDETLNAVRAAAPHLVIIDSKLPDSDPISLVQQLLMLNAFVNTAVITPLSKEEFHEKSEGLGILSQIPLEPGSSEALVLLQKLRQILGLAS
jgi:DNA-binding response OmpR family regulator